MKKVNITGRLLLVTLVLALLASAFTAFAAAETDGYDYDELFKVLEYYEEPVIADESFDGMTAGALDSSLVTGTGNGQTAEIVEAGGNKYLVLTTADKDNTAPILASWYCSDDSANAVIMSFDVQLGALSGDALYDCLFCGLYDQPVSDLLPGNACPTCGMDESLGMLYVKTPSPAALSLYVSDVAGAASAEDKLLVKMVPALNTVTYADGSATQTVTGLTVSADSWYTVTVVWNDGSYSVTVADKAAAAGTAPMIDIKDAEMPVEELASVGIGSVPGKEQADKNASVTVALDNVYVQGGTYLRDQADKQTVVDNALLELASVYKNDADQAMKDEALSVFNKIVNGYGFTSDNADVKAVVAELLSVVQVKFSGAFVTAVAAIDATAEYTVRAAAAEAAGDALAVVPADLSALSEQEKKAFDDAKAAYDAECALLTKIKTDADAYIAIANSADVNSTDYKALLKVCTDSEKYVPDATYPGVNDATAIITKIAKKVADIKAGAEAFILAVNELEAAADHTARVEKYLVAKKAYFDNTTFDGVDAAVEKYATIQLQVSYDQVKVFADTVDETSGYAKRADHVKAFKAYRDLIPSAPADITDEAYRAAAEKFDSEVAALAVIDEQTRAFIAAVAAVKPNIVVDDYASVKEIFAQIKDIEYDPTHPEVKDAHTTYTDLQVRLDNFETNGASFIKFVAQAKAAGDDFATKYANYSEAVKYYFDNETYPGITDALVDFNALKTAITPVETQAKEYIGYINSAKYAMYLSAKESFLDEADKLVEGLELTFPGVSDAQTLYGTIRAEIAAKKEAAAKYIAAVNAIEGKTGQALVDAIAAAQALKAEGDVSGVAGVVEANIALSNAVSAIEVLDGYTARFIELVGLIAKAETPEARFTAIMNARAIESKANASDSKVVSAKATLASAVQSYNSAATEANATLAEVNEVAVSVATGATAALPAGLAGKVVAIVKKIFE